MEPDETVIDVPHVPEPEMPDDGIIDPADDYTEGKPRTLVGEHGPELVQLPPSGEAGTT